MARLYKYVGSESLEKQIPEGTPGTVVHSGWDVIGFIEKNIGNIQIGYEIICTFVIDSKGQLRISDRHSEHVVCAGGNSVMSAGEITFHVVAPKTQEVFVSEVTNQSTGYCPEPESWNEVRRALERTGMKYPDSFSHEFIFRKCTKCGSKNIVKEDVFVCGVCDAELPPKWNFA